MTPCVARAILQISETANSAQRNEAYQRHRCDLNKLIESAPILRLKDKFIRDLGFLDEAIYVLGIDDLKRCNPSLAQHAESVHDRKDSQNKEAPPNGDTSTAAPSIAGALVEKFKAGEIPKVAPGTPMDAIYAVAKTKTVQQGLTSRPGAVGNQIFVGGIPVAKQLLGIGAGGQMSDGSRLWIATRYKNMDQLTIVGYCELKSVLPNAAADGDAGATPDPRTITYDAHLELFVQIANPISVHGAQDLGWSEPLKHSPISLGRRDAGANGDSKSWNSDGREALRHYLRHEAKPTPE